jgi:transcriptional regulator GlxA family with amidase domain
MDDSLLNLKEFYLFTFFSTSNALKAESVLKEQSFDFIVIPTLREISSSCGLSIKVRPADVEKCRQIFVDNRVKAEKYYHVLKEGKKYLIKEFPFSP